MTWTYAAAPDTTTAAGKRDAIRILIGDTDTTDQLLSDEAISFFIGQEPGVYHAGAQAASAIAATFARQADKAVGDLRLSASQQAIAYRELAKDLKRRAVSTAGIWSGGISIADKQAREDDTDRAFPFFSRRLHAVPGVDPSVANTGDQAYREN